MPDPTVVVPPTARSKTGLRQVAERSARTSFPLVLWAVAIGVVGAVGAAIFHECVELATHSFHAIGEASSLPAIPVGFLVGGLCLVALEWLFPGEVLGYGFPRFLEMLHLQQARVKRRWMFIKTIATALSLGAGASVGREGPIAQIGGSMAAALARLTRRTLAERKVLIACGTAAGIAANFNAPIGAVMFAQEVVLLGQAELAHLSLVVVSAATAVAATRGIFGTAPLFEVVPFELGSYWECVTYAVLGIVLGVLAVGYIRFFHGTVRRVNELRAPRALILLGGLTVVSLICVLLPQNFADGYPAINRALAGEIAWQLALMLAAAKILASVISLACGAPGGVFGPIFFIGAMSGASFRALSELVWPDLTGPRGSYALVGLGGFLAATTHAPLTALFLLFEITENYTVAVPALLTVGLGVLVSYRLEEESIDTYGLTAQGKQLHARAGDDLEGLVIGDNFRRDIDIVPEGCPLQEVLRIVGDSEATSLPVVDRDQHFVGMLSFSALQTAVLEGGVGPFLVARDLCEAHGPPLTRTTTLADAFRRFEASGIESLPVVEAEGDGKVLGILSRADLISAYNQAQLAKAPAMGRFLDGGTDWSGRHRVVTVVVPAPWVGKSLRQVDCRSKYLVHVLAIRYGGQESDAWESPDPDRPLNADDVIVLGGARESLKILQKELS